jgi:hypothetical protein
MEVEITPEPSEAERAAILAALDAAAPDPAPWLDEADEEP